MIIQLRDDITQVQKDQLIDQINSIGYKITAVKTQIGEYLIGIGKADFDIRRFGHFHGIKDIHIVSDDYKLVSKNWTVHQTSDDLGEGVYIKDGTMSIMAGPCYREAEEQLRKVNGHLKAAA